jgi:hypothetical protein
LIERALELETGRRMKQTDDLRERNTETLRRLEAQATQCVEQAAIEALESAGANMPLAESAARGVYAEVRSASIEAAAVNVS